MAKLPKKVKVAAFDMVVEPMSAAQVHATGIVGDFNHLIGRIRVEGEAADSIQQLDTLLHEVGHAIWWAV